MYSEGGSRVKQAQSSLGQNNSVGTNGLAHLYRAVYSPEVSNTLDYLYTPRTFR